MGHGAMSGRGVNVYLTSIKERTKAGGRETSIPHSRVSVLLLRTAKQVTSSSPDQMIKLPPQIPT
jgi:hypothetical protein